MVNTFMAYPSLTLKWLDTRRLGKQRVEAFQIIRAIEGVGKSSKSSSWRNHPATYMWQNHCTHLKVYYNACLAEWEARGFRNEKLVPYTIANESRYHIVDLTGMSLEAISRLVRDRKTFDSFAFPWWCGFEHFYMAHRAALMRKTPEHYIPLFGLPGIEAYLRRGYIWPHTIDPLELPSQFSDTTSYHPIASGAPPQCRHSLAICKKWSSNKKRNPMTGSPIQPDGPLGRDFKAALDWYRRHTGFEHGLDHLVSSVGEAISLANTTESLVENRPRRKRKRA